MSGRAIAIIINYKTIAIIIILIIENEQKIKHSKLSEIFSHYIVKCNGIFSYNQQSY